MKTPSDNVPSESLARVPVVLPEFVHEQLMSREFRRTPNHSCDETISEPALVDHARGTGSVAAYRRRDTPKKTIDEGIKPQ